MRSKLLVICTAVFGIASLLPADARNSDSAAAIGAVEERLARAETRRDASAIREALADDVTLLPPGEPPLSGREEASRWLARRPSDSVSHERLKASGIDVCGDYAIESGAALPESCRTGTVSSAETRYVSIWRRGADDSWKLRQTIWTRFSVASARSTGPVDAAPIPPAAAPPAAAQPVPPIPPPPPSDYLPIPDPRSLSDGFVRTIADQLRGRVAKIRSLQGAAGSADAARAAIAKADRELQAVIRDVGWIDVSRFGVRASCDAAFIVSVSGDPLLIRSTVSRMGDLQSNSEGEACYVGAYEAYRKLSP